MAESFRHTVKWDSKEGLHHIHGEHNDPGLVRLGDRESQPWLDHSLKRSQGGSCSWREKPASSRHKMGESFRHTVNWDSKEGSHHIPGELNDPGLGRQRDRESQPRLHHSPERSQGRSCSWREIPSSSSPGMGESFRHSVQWHSKEGPHHIPGEHNDPGLMRLGDRESQPRLHRSPERIRGGSCRTRKRSRSGILEPGFRPSSDRSTRDPCKLFAEGNQTNKNLDRDCPVCGNPLPLQDVMSMETDVVNTVKSGTVQSAKDTMSTVQLNFTLSLSQLRGLFAARNASNILGSRQSSVPCFSSPVVHPSVSSQPEPDSEYEKLYDPVTDSLELIESIIREQADELKLDSSENKENINEKAEMPSKLPLAGEPIVPDLYKTCCNNVNTDSNSNGLSIKDEIADCKGEENNIMKAEEKNKGQDSCDLKNIEGDGKADEKMGSNDGKSVKDFKFALAEFVKELLKPTWKEGILSKEAHKTIVKKVVDKVTASIEGVHMPQSQASIESYLSSFKPKISKLLQAYVDRLK